MLNKVIAMIDINAFFKVSYGLYIVSSGNQQLGNGFISNTVFQVTSEPARFAACCNKNNFTAKMIQNEGVFSISILEQDASMDLIALFGYQSGKNVNKLERANVTYGETGVPIVISDSIAYFECKLIQTFDVGTHVIFIGEVVSSKALKDKPALTYEYYRAVKKGVAPKNAPTYIDKSKIDLDSKPQTEESADEVYKCAICGYEHSIADGDPKSNIDPGLAWNKIPDTYQCPLCGAAKEDFYRI